MWEHEVGLEKCGALPKRFYQPSCKAPPLPAGLGEDGLQDLGTYVGIEFLWEEKKVQKGVDILVGVGVIHNLYRKQ